MCVYIYIYICCSVVSDSLQPHGLQHIRLSCPSPSPGACSNSCPLSRWCHPTISSSVVSFSSCLAERERERERFIIGTGFHDDGSWEATWSALCKLKNQESCWYHNWYNYNAIPRSVNQEHQCLRAEEKEIEFSLPLPFGFVGAHWIGWCLLALGRVIIFLYSVYRFKCQPLPDTFLQTNPEIMF